MIHGVITAHIFDPENHGFDTNIIDIFYSIWHPLLTPIRISYKGRLYLNGFENVTIRLNVSKTYESHTNVGRFLLFLHVNPSLS